MLLSRAWLILMPLVPLALWRRREKLVPIFVLTPLWVSVIAPVELLKPTVSELPLAMNSPVVEML